MTAEQLIQGFQTALRDGWGYIYGMSHDMWSLAKQAAYVNAYHADPDRANSCKYGDKWAGHWVTDCSGLFHYWGKKHGLDIPHGSNSIWDKACTAKGTLSRGARTDGQQLKPGTAVFTSNGERHNHIGLYVGGDTVIEAQGCEAGVTTSKITNKRWTHWGELKGVIYREEGETRGMNAKVVLPAGATGNTVNMRAQGSRSAAILERVPVGAEVDILNDMGAWCFVEYKGKTGWMMSNYLEYDGQTGESQTVQPEESEGDILTFAELDKIHAALDEIDRQTEIIRSTIGRG